MVKGTSSNHKAGRKETVMGKNHHAITAASAQKPALGERTSLPACVSKSEKQNGRDGGPQEGK
jgi:hypothetical protein